MRKVFVFLILVLALSQLCQAQTYLPDTIRVNRTTTTYLIFPSKVSLVDISPEYLVKIESENIVFVRPRTSSARSTPILVRTSNNTYLGYLSVSSNLPPAFVEISKLHRPPMNDSKGQETSTIAKPDSPSGADNDLVLDSISPEVDKLLQFRMDTLLSGRPKSYAQERNSGILVALTHLLHDSVNTYVQLSITNKTAMPYLLDQVSFWYQNQARKQKGVYLDGETYPMEPVFEEAPERIETNQRVRLRFVLPQFAPQSRSQFVINVREKSGTRNVTLNLPMRTVLYAHQRPSEVHQKHLNMEGKKNRLSNVKWFWNDWKKKV